MTVDEKTAHVREILARDGFMMHVVCHDFSSLLSEHTSIDLGLGEWGIEVVVPNEHEACHLIRPYQISSHAPSPQGTLPGAVLQVKISPEMVKSLGWREIKEPQPQI